MNNPFLKVYTGDKTDATLVESAQNGSKAALEELLLKHQPFIYNVAWKMVRHPADAKDLTQEALIKIVTNLSKFKGESKFSTWCYRIVVNHFLASKRKASEKIFTSFEVHANALEQTPDSNMTEAEQKANEKLIKEMNYSCMSGMLLCLNRDQRMVYILGEMFDADQTIGSEILNISKDNYRKRLSRARKDMFNYMNNKCGLVNKENPCRCHKKVQFAIDNKIIDAKNLLFNRKEHASFKEMIKPDADFMIETVEDKFDELYRQMPFKKDFDKKTFLLDIINDEKINQAMRLN
ncbi:hypothetical protein GCM10011344_06450 [Dokdonia pacifica]|uniref:RNA polymerase, sigma subunit, ECF family n=1 Tax=Dokdonia pacifica TaxID=1627892 RepID=A0A238Z3J1_9FLAO|nr:RNA polymerase sigma factor [Dokdonia pacifica]GGG08607.1 hypothetical protein GCM10011344_06450 [Dokdonia pacifica]SNR77558.1 RNA polymerase, sigma subunit, ECF family [Dokdonia pacifica]